MGPADDITDLWHDHHQHVMDLAYRMLGSVAEAEDITQETFLRVARTDRTTIEDVRGWLITVTARLCLDQLRSARVRRARYVGPWLPEPLVSLPGDQTDPADRVTLDDSIRLALLALLERLSPAERTAFVLHDLFGMPFEEVSEIVGRTVPACRQLASRARRHVRADQHRFAVDADEHRRTVEEFVRACGRGDLRALVDVLDPDATGEFDSGGLLPGAPDAVVAGATRIGQLLLGAFDGLPARFLTADVNGEPGAVVILRGRIVAVMAVHVRAGRATHIHAVGNPRKLRHLRGPAVRSALPPTGGPASDPRMGPSPHHG